MLFLYTDRVTEATNLDGDLFRVHRLMDVAQEFAARSPEELMLAVIDQVERFSSAPCRPTTLLASWYAATAWQKWRPKSRRPPARLVLHSSTRHARTEMPSLIVGRRA
jgi:stage II sporulation SpoE-like protein